MAKLLDGRDLKLQQGSAQGDAACDCTLQVLVIVRLEHRCGVLELHLKQDGTLMAIRAGCCSRRRTVLSTSISTVEW